MQVRANFGASVGAGFAHNVRRPRLRGDLVRREVRRPHTQAVEEPLQPPHFPDVLHGDPRPRRHPVVLLGVHRDNHQYVAARARHVGRGAVPAPGRRPPPFPARRLPDGGALAPRGPNGGVQRRHVADHDVRGHGAELRQWAALRPPPPERRAQSRERCEPHAPASPRSARDETHQRGERQHADVRHEPAADLAAGEDPREHPPPRPERVQQLALEGQRVPATGDGADLPAVLLPQRRQPCHEAHRIPDRDRPQAQLAREEDGGEIAAQSLGQDVHLDRGPHRVQTPRRPDDPGDTGLQMAHPHVIADVPRLTIVGVLLNARDAHVVARRHAHRGIDEARHQRFQSPPLHVDRSVGIHDDLAPEQGQGGVLRRRFPHTAWHPQ